MAGADFTGADALWPVAGEDPPQAAKASAAAMPKMSKDDRMRACFAEGTQPPARLQGVPVCRPNMDASPHRNPHGHLPGRPAASRIVAWLDGLSPYWGPQLVVLTALLLDLALPDRLTAGPAWLLPSVEGALLLLLVLASPHPLLRRSPARRYLSMLLIALVSAVNLFSLIELTHFLLHGNVQNGRALVFSGIALWGTNVLLFGLWFYELDGGGPAGRAMDVAQYPDFLFVQMSDGREFTQPGWKPRLVDYLYTSFTNATAFSPTDTMPLTPTAKWLMSVQSMASLITIGLVVARAVNILQG